MIAPAQLATHYRHFGVADRILLTGHSHQAWPDVARDALLEAYDDAATEVDDKWERALAKAELVRTGVRRWLADPDGEIVLGANTHELVVRFLSALDLAGRPRLVTTDGEFHTLRRQLSRLDEAGLEVVGVPAAPVATLAERLAAEVDTDTAAVLVSSVLFETSRRVPHLAELATVCTATGTELLLDAYHQVGVMALPVHETGLSSAWIVGGGYKYLQLGEGNCFLRLPPQAAALRPVVTGWYAEIGELAHRPRPGRVGYAPGAAGWAGATYDPVSHYRAARVLAFFDEMGLTPHVLRERYRRQRALLADAVDALDAPEHLLTRDRETPAEEFAGFLSLRSDCAEKVRAALQARGVSTDVRGDHLRLGPAPYVTDDQLRTAAEALGEVVRAQRQTKTA